LSSLGTVGLLFFNSAAAVFEEMIDQKRKVFESFPQRGNLDLMSDEPEIQVLAKGSLLLLVLKIGVIGRYNPRS